MKKRKIDLKNKTTIDQFKPILQKYRDYKTFLRDIKISCVLGQKIQFDIEDINPPISVHQYNHKYIIDVGWSREIKIYGMKFIINSELEVEELEIDYKGDEITDDISVRYLNSSDPPEIYGFMVEL